MNIEGKNAVREAILNKQPIEKIIASNQIYDKNFNEIIALAKQNNIKIQFVSNDVLNKNAQTKNHQGLIAYGAEYNYFEVSDILLHAKNKNEQPFIVILDQISDPHNFGSIIRVCECMGVHGIIIAKDRACTVNSTVIKVSAGAVNYVKIAKVTNINREIENLKKLNFWVYALELGGKNIVNTSFAAPCAIVVGSEGRGVSALTKKMCDSIVSISMFGKINSLNASVAAGIALYEASKQIKGNSYDKK